MKKNDIIFQLDNLKQFSDTNQDLTIDESWKAQLKQIVATYIDKDSPFLEQIDKLKFTVTHAGEPTPEYFLKYYNIAKTDASILIFHITEYIKQNGLKLNGNFLSKLSDTWATALIISGAGFIFWLGSWTSQNKIDAEKIGFKNKIDSLSLILRTTPITTRSKLVHLDTNTIQNKNTNIPK